MPSAGASSPHAVVNAMTIDVEDYFHVSVFDGLVPRDRWDGLESRVCANTQRLLTIFDEVGITATFFILGWVAERFPELVREIGSQGHEIACHGYQHRLVYDQTPSSFRDDIRKAKDLLESVAQTSVIGYRAPSYSITARSLWALDILIEEGFRYDASIFPIRHDRYGIPLSPRTCYPLERKAGTLMEVPASTVRCGPLNLPVAGGGYFRLLPYAWTRWGIARLNDGGQAAVFYLHPWEIDPQQPRLEAGALGSLRHYRNLDKTETRLRALLEDFAFGPMDTLLQTRNRQPMHDAADMRLPYFW
jgi:polysaccharide deacetylase family protein (PEP-CTERM system associated)